MTKKWLVYPFTAEDFEHGAAREGLIQAIDPDNKDEVVTLRVSDRDCDDLDTWLSVQGYRSGWVTQLLFLGGPIFRLLRLKWPGAPSVARRRYYRPELQDLAVPFEWHFTDTTEVADRRPLQPPEASKA